MFFDIHSNFQLILLCSLSERGWNSWFSFMQKFIAQFLPRLSLASYFCCLLLHSFLTTKRHPSDVEPSYISIFRLIQSAVYPVDVSKDCSFFTQMVDYNSKDLVWILTKIHTDNCLWTPYKWTKVQLDWSTNLWVTAIFFKCAKRRRRRKKNTWKFSHSNLRNALRDFLRIWCVVSLGRQAPPQQLWCSSDKRSWSYECVKIATLLFLFIYSLFSWVAQHTTMRLDNSPQGGEVR